MSSIRLGIALLALACFSAFAQNADTLEALAAKGEPHSQFLLGQAYFRGSGVTQSDLLAYQWFEKAAAQGDAQAQGALGFLYAEGRGVPRNLIEAQKWLRLAVDQQAPFAQHNLGLLLLRQDSSRDEGAALLEKAAESGYMPSQARLGQIYYFGEFGVPRDYAKSFSWFQKAAAAGNWSAQNSLGAMYRSGLGTSCDLTEAFKWFQRSAENGYAPAQGNLGYFYAAGTTVPRDVVVAYKWLKLGAAGGDVASANQLSEISKVLTSEQIKRGDLLVADFRPASQEARP